MSWKGNVRSFAAAARRIKRNQQRRARVAAQDFKQLQKQQAVTSAAQAVAAYNEYLSVIKSMHHDCSDPLDWFSAPTTATPSPTPSTTSTSSKTPASTARAQHAGRNSARPRRQLRHPPDAHT